MMEFNIPPLRKNDTIFSRPHDLNSWTEIERQSFSQLKTNLNFGYCFGLYSMAGPRFQEISRVDDLSDFF